MVALATIALGTTTYCRNLAYADDVTIWSDVVGKADHNYRGHLWLSAAYLALKQYGPAAEQARQSLRENPRQPKALNNLGLALAKLGKTDEAAARYAQALRLDPHSSEAHLNLGNLLRASDPEAAVRHFQSAVQFAPDYIEAHNNLGAMLARRDPEAALQHYRKALLLNPKNPHTHCNLANLLGRQGRFDEAIRHYQQALVIDPEFALARENLRFTLRMQHEASRAKPIPAGVK
jgi:tetratricopeptide (TPR) repeat protein